MNNFLNVHIENDQLVISVGTEYLLNYLQGHYLYNLGEPILIPDENAFLKEFTDYILKEEEDGATMIHQMFDDVFSDMAEQGADTLEFGE